MAPPAPPAPAREIVDMAGRHVQIPDRIERVYGSAPPLSVLLLSWLEKTAASAGASQ